MVRHLSCVEQSPMSDIRYQRSDMSDGVGYQMSEQVICRTMSGTHSLVCTRSNRLMDRKKCYTYLLISSSVTHFSSVTKNVQNKVILFQWSVIFLVWNKVPCRISDIREGICQPKKRSQRTEIF